MSLLRKRVKHYGKLPSSTIRDERLKDGALGLLLRIVDLPENWVVRADNMAAGRPQGRDATAAELRNLAQCGYYRVERRKMRDGKFQMGNAISEECVPQWEAEYAEFEGKPIPLIEQPDGSFKVRRKDGSTTDDGFVGEYAPGVNDLPCPGETPGRTGNGKPGTGQVDLSAWSGETDITGHGFSGSGNPASGDGGPISTTETGDRDVPAVPGVFDQLPLDDAAFPVRAVGALTAVTREAEAPTANEQDHLSRQSWHVATMLPRRYRDGLPPEFRFPMVHAIRGVLAEGVGVAAVLRYAQLCATNAEYARDRHLPLLRAAIALLRHEVRMGLVCPECGNEPGDPFGPPCHRCRSDRHDLTDDDLVQLEAARRFLNGADHDDREGEPGPLPFDDQASPHASPQAPCNGAWPVDATQRPPSAYSEADGDLRGASDSRGDGGDHDGGAEAPSG